jgi:4-hydroxy-3-polyprenylbenzoate decarboxylase
LGGITGVQCLWYDAAARRQRVALATFRICADGTIALDARTRGLLPRTGLSEMALVMGGEPLLTWCAGLPLPPMVDRYLVGSWLRQKPLQFAPCLTHGLCIPTEADIVLEGIWDAARGRMQVNALTQRANPTLSLLLPGERRWMDVAYSRLMLPLIRFMLDDVVDVHLRDEVALVSVRGGRGRDAIYSFWGMASILPQRTVIAFDEMVDIWDARAVEGVLSGAVDWERDVMVSRDTPEALTGVSPRIGIDASRASGVLRSDMQ